MYRFRFSQCYILNYFPLTGVWRDRMWPDGWTAVTADGKRSAQFEHTLLVRSVSVEHINTDLFATGPWIFFHILGS